MNLDSFEESKTKIKTFCLTLVNVWIAAVIVLWNAGKKPRNISEGIWCLIPGEIYWGFLGKVNKRTPESNRG